jgi:hypothetical protein
MENIKMFYEVDAKSIFEKINSCKSFYFIYENNNKTLDGIIACYNNLEDAQKKTSELNYIDLRNYYKIDYINGKYCKESEIWSNPLITDKNIKDNAKEFCYEYPSKIIQFNKKIKSIKNKDGYLLEYNININKLKDKDMYNNLDDMIDDNITYIKEKYKIYEFNFE